ncbi:hypothetical protein [Kordiimonas lacus]|uniref:Uncharacterized protein n=1 Tax=Kordiimonas lacus TaxID=637679 RepID=A0A1G7F4R7_9PROT|nr:hypothetical protein [Kordiimonas lacus]SDE70867.1 hypothetical protein SAMN04488071_3616 [Kordiimonas lacus]
MTNESRLSPRPGTDPGSFFVKAKTWFNTLAEAFEYDQQAALIGEISTLRTRVKRIEEQLKVDETRVTSR